MEEDGPMGFRPCGRLFCYLYYISAIFNSTLAINQLVTILADKFFPDYHYSSAMKIVTLESLYRGSIFQSARSWIPDQNRFGNDRFGNWRMIDDNQEFFFQPTQ